MKLYKKIILIKISLFIYIISAFSTTNIKQTNFFNDYGPVTICSNKLNYNKDKSHITYYGGVTVLQIKGVTVNCNQPIENNEKNNVYFYSEQNHSFTDNQNKWLKEASTICKEKKGCNFLTGQVLVVKINKNGKVSDITMKSIGNNFSKFYSYPSNTTSGKNTKLTPNENLTDSEKSKNKLLTQQNSFKGPLLGTAKIINYSIEKNKVFLKKHASVKQSEDMYKGNDLIYDLRTERIISPGTKYGRASITFNSLPQISTFLGMGSSKSDKNENKNIDKKKVNE